ncbi:MAG: hypothetical protein R8G66_22490 [Cytophagales bacterium]|nr:hypothetical protein [Cytophagales bacterium]
MTKPKFLFLTSFLIFSTSLFAQNDFREIGLSVRDEFNLAFVYKKQRAENRYISFDVLFANLSVSSNSGRSSTSFSTGLSVTFENRKEIAEKVQFIHGWAPSLSIGNNRSSGNNSDFSSTIFTPGVGYRLGFMYLFAEQFYASLQGQIGASMSYQFNPDIDGTPATFNAGFSQQDVSLILAYRFRKRT